MAKKGTHPAEAEIRRILVKRARQQSSITYSELADLLRTLKLIPDSRFLFDLLTSISRQEYAADRGLLSGVVVCKTTAGYGLPGVGFFKRFAPGLKPRDFRQWWQQERDKIYEAWGR
jgi:hypothetical protein